MTLYSAFERNIPGMQDAAFEQSAPSLTISEDDARLLTTLVSSSAAGRKGLVLLRKLNSAKLVSRYRIGLDVVRLNLIVEYSSSAKHGVHRQRLALPGASRHDHDLSVLTPVGAALLGVRVGHKSTYVDDLGAEHEVCVLSVEHPGIAISSGSALETER